MLLIKQNLIILHWVNYLIEGWKKKKKKKGLLKRLKKIEDKNEKQLKEIEDQGEKELDAIKKIINWRMMKQKI